MAKKKVKDVSFTMQFVNIELLEFSLMRAEGPLTDNQPVSFNIGMEQRLDKSSKIAFVASMINVLDKSEDGKILCRIATSCNFRIENMEDFTDAETGTVTLPEQAVVSLNAIAISTTRGVLFSELRGTYLHGAIIPVLDPSKFAKAQTDSGSSPK